jgi:hypothetical protein
MGLPTSGASCGICVALSDRDRRNPGCHPGALFLYPRIKIDPSMKTEHVMVQVCGDCGSLHKLLPVCQPTRV